MAPMQNSVGGYLVCMQGGDGSILAEEKVTTASLFTCAVCKQVILTCLASLEVVVVLCTEGDYENNGGGCGGGEIEA